MIGGFAGFGALDLEDDAGRKTWPPAGSATLTIDDEKEALFISATWTVRARVDGVALWESKPRDRSHGDAFVRQWARFVIRKHYDRLRELGVDATKEYVNFGGKADELE